MPPPFYRPTTDPDRFIGTPSCAGSWSPDLQHGGPPAALLLRTIGQVESSIDGLTQLSRFTAEILGPIPVGEVTVTAAVSRRGRSVELVEANLTAAGRVGMTVRAWRMRVEPMSLPVRAGVYPVAGLPGFVPGETRVPPLPDQPGPLRLPIWLTGYADAIEWRFVTGSEDGGTPVAVWARPRVDLVAGEDASALCRLALLADTGNGLSRMLDVHTWWFINPELTVHLHRQPAGDWFLLAARSIVEETGNGLTETELYDISGRVGRAAQALLVGRR